uniref:DUF4218 domain-containing protein n=1 Tax=Tanacetum cinerariifolium TaxID=118510 RepID=A0A6L2KGE5_TANCI|nr:hypothetical protein [Tanacetum cinerariifolium]
MYKQWDNISRMGHNVVDGCKLGESRIILCESGVSHRLPKLQLNFPSDDETTLNDVKTVGLMGDGFGSTPEMSKQNMFWVVTKTLRASITCFTRNRFPELTMLMFYGVTRINLSLVGATSDVEKNSSDRGKRKLTTYEDFDVFETYSQLSTRNVRPRFLSDLPQASGVNTSQPMCKEVISSMFVHIESSGNQNINDMLHDAEHNAELDMEKLQQLFVETEKPFYTCFNKLLELFNKMLPKNNELPTSTYQAKKLMCSLGLEVQRIDACSKDCILYRKGYVLWHVEDRKHDGKIRHVADASQWKNINNHYTKFRAEIINIRFRLSSDGINPLGNMNSRHNLWDKGVEVYDAYKKERFKLFAMIFCTVSDFRRTDIKTVFGKKDKAPKNNKNIWKKKSRFWKLPYWEHLQVRHSLNVMHIEKNVSESLIGFLLNIKGKTKDGINARKDMVEMGIRDELATQEIVPSGYSANIKKLVSMKDLKLIVIDPKKLDEWQRDIILTLCQLEMYFPPSFFDVMVHLVSHIVEEIKALGPIFLHYMYPFERYMGFFKGKRSIVGVENVVDEDEYNQFDELPPFSIGIQSVDEVLDDTIYLRSNHQEGHEAED